MCLHASTVTCSCCDLLDDVRCGGEEDCDGLPKLQRDFLLIYVSVPVLVV
jgi:hypothetical protein